jgi:hypothetical protein
VGDVEETILAMQRSDFNTPEELARYIERLEREYTDQLFHALYKNAGNIQAWYNEPNKVPDTWVGKMVISPREPSAPWEQVGEIVITVYQFDQTNRYQYLTDLQLFTVPNGILRTVRNCTDIFQVGKDGRQGHRYRVNLPALAKHEAWRWREIRYQAQGFTVVR